MKRIFRTISRMSAAAVLCTSALAMAGAENPDLSPRWLRNTAISPDGRQIAFTYKGDIFIVPAEGGTARQLTSSDAIDTAPVWSPDGRIIVFGSNRNGMFNLFRINSDGGTPECLTTGYSGLPVTFLNDSTVMYNTSTAVDPKTSHFPSGTQVYTVNVNRPGSRPKLYMGVAAPKFSVNRAGKMLYQDKKGFENSLRKHERSSGTSDIWLRDNGKFTKLTDFNGHDLNPVWAPGDNSYYYISEQDGTLNVWQSDLGGNRRQLTKFTKHPVRSLSASDNGTLAFSWDGDIYTLTPGSEPRKVNVAVKADNYDRDKVQAYVTGDASRIAVSPDGEQLAFVIRGDVYVTDAKYKTTKRITDTPAQERTVSFSDDGRTLVYDSDRDGNWALFTTTIVNPDEKQFAYSTELNEELLYRGEKAAQQPVFSPDGKKVAFLENRDRICVIDIPTKKVTTVLGEEHNYSYTDGDVEFTWSPDSKWLLTSYLGEGGWNHTDIALVKADGTEVVNLTESGFSNGNPKWVLGGKGLIFTTGKYGMKAKGSWGEQSDVMLMMLDQEGWEDFNATEEEIALKEKAEKLEKEKADKAKDSKKKKKDKKDKEDADDKDAEKIEDLKFDLPNRKYRQARLTGVSSSLGDYYLNKKGDKFYYIAYSPEGKSNLFERDLKKGDTRMVHAGVSGSLITDAKGENLFVVRGGSIRKLNLSNMEFQDVEYVAEYGRKPSLEREYIYDHMLSQVNEKFHDPGLHGTDWKYYGEHYREFLPYISNNFDFADMLSEILGELNASHTGASHRAPGHWDTGNFGAFFDQNYDGDGLKVVEVLPRGPLARKEVNVKPGEIIVSVDGKNIEAGKDYFPLLYGKDNRKVRIGIKGNDGKVRYAEVKMLGSGAFSEMIYQRWVERNQHYVDSISGGKIGYVHVRGMNGDSFDETYDRILGKYRNCDAVVVDTRFNGGGWLHNDLALLLGGKEYVRYEPRGRFIGIDPFSQWTKPSVMLVNESNYSDAHGSPYAYQTLGIGEIVGAPIPGTMTAVWWENQIDSSIVFGIPQVTSVDRKGKALENQQLQPDVLIYNNPGDELRGYDAQLKGAVEHLMKKTGNMK